MGVGIHRSKIALYIYDKTFEDNDEDKIVDADFIERNMGFYEMLDEWKNLINHDVVSELVEPLYDELESFAVCTDTTMSVYRVDKVYGHPHQETLDLLDSKAYSPKLYRTDLDGDIIVKSDGKSVTIED